jgi:hypothetical protein
MMSASADGFSSTFVMPSSAARAAMAGDGTPVTSRTGNCHPQPVAVSQFQTSDVGHAVVKDKAAHAVDVATLQKRVSQGIVGYLISGKRQQERQRLTHGVVVNSREITVTCSHMSLPSTDGLGCMAKSPIQHLLCAASAAVALIRIIRDDSSTTGSSVIWSRPRYAVRSAA